MKKFILLIVLAIIASSNLNAQFLIKKSDQVTNENIRKVLATRVAVSDYQLIEIDLNQTQATNVTISFFNHQVQLKKERIEKRGTNNFSWFGSDEEKINQAILTVDGSDIQGIVTINNEIFRIETIDNQFVITKIDQSKYPPEACIKNQNLPIEQRDSIPNYRKNTDDNNPIKDKKLYKTYPEQEFWNYQCKLRILVLYTTAAKNAKSGIVNHIQLAIDEMNQSFVNSGVNFQVELVHIEETSYQESSSPTLDLNRFTLNNDGQMDNIHNLKEKFSADVCVLIGAIDSVCGKAAAIKSCEERSFCVVHWNCATGNFTFAHEIGHLIGARHDPNADPNNNPYQYGHGFIAPNNGWRYGIRF